MPFPPYLITFCNVAISIGKVGLLADVATCEKTSHFYVPVARMLDVCVDTMTTLWTFLSFDGDAGMRQLSVVWDTFCQLSEYDYRLVGRGDTLVSCWVRATLVSELTMHILGEYAQYI